MSLAQKAERAPVRTLETAAQPTGASSSKVIAPVDFRQLLRRTAGAQLASVPTPAPVPTPTAMPAKTATPPAARPTSDVALDLLGEASCAMVELMSRCEQLEASLASARADAGKEVDAANEIAREWQQVAQALKVQLEQLEAGTASLKQRLDAAEDRAASIQAVADKSQQTAAEAECLASLFQEKVIASFGLGSAGHSILESVRNRTQSMLTA